MFFGMIGSPRNLINILQNFYQVQKSLVMVDNSPFSLCTSPESGSKKQ